MDPKIELLTDDLLVIDVRSHWFEKLWLLVAAASAGFAAYQWSRDASAVYRDSFMGCVAVTLMGIAGFAVLFERSRFKFDRKSRTLEWSRRRLWSRRAGMVAFDAITLVSVKNSMGSTQTNPSRRVAIHTATEEIPLTVMYTAGLTVQHNKLAKQIREFIGNTSSDPLMDTVRDCVRKGQVMDAIRLLRTEKKLTVNAAKKIVEGL